MPHAASTDGPTNREGELITYLFDDIARLPIITNKAQELWLGVHIRAPRQPLISRSIRRGLPLSRASAAADQRPLLRYTAAISNPID